MISFIILFIVLFGIDLYVYQPVKILLRKRPLWFSKTAKIVYWIFPVIPAIALIVYNNVSDFGLARDIRSIMLTFFSINYIPKIVATIVLGLHDFFHFVSWILKKMTLREDKRKLAGKPISRGEFISKVSIIAGAAPFAAMGFGIIKGAHDYRIRKIELPLKNLPKEFEGITIGQLSDIHTGSFFNKTAVKGGVELLMAEKPDLIFFTGDLVNESTSEVTDYVPIFNKIKAPYGVYSVTGNHDYGDYTRWPSAEAKNKNFQDLKTAHKELGFDLILNGSRELEIGGEKIGILGVENWGAGRFQKYGDLKKTYESLEDSPVKLLLSHDPSHWDAQVKSMYPDIDVMFAGHTHGFQFGIEIGNFKWSPSQYIYKQWAGLYQENDQYLYVNRGFGFLGYPGRIGIPPELTIFKLTGNV